MAKKRNAAVSIGLLAIAAIITYFQGGDVMGVLQSGFAEQEAPVQVGPHQSEQRDNRASGSHRFDELFAAGRSDVIVNDSARIVRVLSDDNKGSRHQRFLVETPAGTTVLIAHNIDLAPRVPDPRVGDSIAFQGEYEWTEKGGVLHWTHHDPAGRHPGGWLEYGGRRYE